ncbi:MAG: diacylglycerol kinase family protein [Eudoraea sp.]|nr:diacylglycerol kinase family protein [Eudoraea sp.]
MKFFLIMNPHSRNGKSRRAFDTIFRMLKEANADFSYKIIDSIEEARYLSSKANLEGVDTIVAVGGDGTIRAVMSGFFDSEGERISHSSLGIIYTGTSPDFCKSYNIPIKTGEAVNVLLEQKTIQIAVGRLACASENNISNNGTSLQKGNRNLNEYFGCCANIGLGASVARTANKGIRKYLGDFCGTLLSVLLAIARYKANTFSVVKDGKITEIGKMYNMSVGLTRNIASGIKVNNSIRAGEKRFYCMVVRGLNIVNTPRVLINAYSGKKFRNCKVHYLGYLNKIEVLGNHRNPEVELDGDPVGFLPCIIQPAKDLLHLITAN